jgi:hypothetical protein
MRKVAVTIAVVGLAACSSGRPAPPVRAEPEVGTKAETKEPLGAYLTCRSGFSCVVSCFNSADTAANDPKPYHRVSGVNNVSVTLSAVGVPQLFMTINSKSGDRSVDQTVIAIGNSQCVFENMVPNIKP